MRSLKTHLRWKSNATASICGRQNVQWAKNRAEVTCAQCIMISSPRQRQKRKLKAPPDIQRVGRGKMRCYICDRPIRDHGLSESCLW